MGITNTNRVRKYDGKELWEMYMSWGAASSHRKLRGWLLDERGIKSSQMGPFWCMWRYALKNPEEAFPAYKKWHFDTASNRSDGVVIDGNITFEKFLEDVRNHAKGKKTVVGTSVYKSFCQKYNLVEYP